jgi:hypothetical protein
MLKPNKAAARSASDPPLKAGAEIEFIVKWFFSGVSDHKVKDSEKLCRFFRCWKINQA